MEGVLTSGSPGMSPENSLWLIPSRISVSDPGRPRIRGSGHRLKFGAAQRLFASYWLCPRKERSPHIPQSIAFQGAPSYLTHWSFALEAKWCLCWDQMSLMMAIQGHRPRLAVPSGRVGTEGWPSSHSVSLTWLDHWEGCNVRSQFWPHPGKPLLISCCIFLCK